MIFAYLLDYQLVFLVVSFAIIIEKTVPKIPDLGYLLRKKYI